VGTLNDNERGVLILRVRVVECRMVGRRTALAADVVLGLEVDQRTWKVALESLPGSGTYSTAAAVAMTTSGRTREGEDDLVVSHGCLHAVSIVGSIAPATRMRRVPCGPDHVVRSVLVGSRSTWVEAPTPCPMNGRDIDGVVR
jgi:hypothetical protein